MAARVTRAALLALGLLLAASPAPALDFSAVDEAAGKKYFVVRDADRRPVGSRDLDAIAQIEQAEKWLNQHKDDAGLLLALGKLCLHQGLWGKAQSYLDASVSVAPSPAAYTALAQLAEKLGKPAEASGYYQKATRTAKPAA